MDWNVAEYQRTVFSKLRLEPEARERVLDLGCGDGADAAWLARRADRVVGIDLTPHPSWSRLARDGLEFMSADGERLPFADESFDLVFMKDVLHHASHPERILHEVRRVCGPGGRIHILEANRLNPIFYIHMTLMLGHQHFRRLAFQKLVKSVFTDATFIHFEAHVYPFRRGALVTAARAFQELMERVPLLERLASYNAAIIASPTDLPRQAP
jgi:ubiquinone/menaquinone biosynthesis C-methylase UbiE